MKVLDCTLLAYEGSIFRAYVSVLKQLGYKAKRVVKLYNGHHRWPCVPRCLKQIYWSNKEALEHNFYPQLFLKNAAFTQSIVKPILKKYALPADFFEVFGLPIRMPKNAFIVILRKRDGKANACLRYCNPLVPKRTCLRVVV